MARKSKPDPAEADLFSGLEPPPLTPPSPPVDRPLLVPAAAPPSAFSQREGELRHLAEVAVEGPMHGTLTYDATMVWEQLRPGMRVRVPFGTRYAVGFFIGERDMAGLRREGVPLDRVRPILDVLDDGESAALLTPHWLALARWMARHYARPLGSTLAEMLPAAVKSGAESARVRVVVPLKPADELLRCADERATKRPKQAALLRAIADRVQGSGFRVQGTTPPPLPLPASGEGVGGWGAAALLRETGASDAALHALAKAGLIEITTRPAREIAALTPAERTTPLTLNAEQRTALDAIKAPLLRNQFGAFLLQGVTGSGKTEVYLQCLDAALALGKQAIVMVPEIALTPQTVRRFEGRLGRERVAVLHSRATPGERAAAWRDVAAGRRDVVVGTLMALFAPLPRLGVIVIDEEHESAFRSLKGSHYHPRDVAYEMARLSNAVLILGTATPSLESLYASMTGKLQRLHLTERVLGRPMPPVEIVDLTAENRDTQRYTYLSRRLVHGLTETFARGEQAILFLNRRGFATVLTCPHCGQTEKCEHCDITLVSERQSEALVCHYCGYHKPIPTVCSSCLRPGLKHWGMGTERVESEVRKLFPDRRIARMDSDTMSGRKSHADTLGRFQAGQLDVLIGTQMIAKGLDFPNVTLVGVVLADTVLHLPDFRSRERTFQLIAQVAGRTGRSEKGGTVIVQTHLPNDPALRAAVRHDYETFTLAELAERRTFAYPPYTRLARLVIRATKADAAKAAAQAAAEALRQQVVAMGLASPTVEILGPSEPPIAKIRGCFRQHIVLKTTGDIEFSDLLGGPVARTLLRLKGAKCLLDVDPVDML